MRISNGLKIDEQGRLIWLWTDTVKQYVTGVDKYGPIYFFKSLWFDPDEK